MKLRPALAEEVPDALADIVAANDNLLLDYQVRANALTSVSPLTLIDKSRRIGLTWGIASEAVLVAASARGQGGMDVLYTSYSHDMTREFIDACSMWAKAFGTAVSLVDDYLFEDQDEHGNSKFIKAFRIDFASGFSIVALPSTPRSLRGRQGMVIIDEAAFVNDLAEVLKAALALLMWGGRVVVISTHNGIDNPFNQLKEEIKAGRRKGGTMTITFADAMAEGLYERICLVSHQTPTPEGKIKFEADIRASYGDAASEELDCIPAAGAGSFIPAELVVAAQHPDANKPELYAGRFCYGGRDVARRRDGAPMWVFEQIDNVLWLRERPEPRGATFAVQDEIFDGQFKRYRIVRYGVDQTGMGEKVVEDAQTRHGDRVEGILFTGPNKLMMANAMLRRFQDGTIRIDDDPEVRMDFRAIKRAKTKGDVIRLVNDSEMVHADKFWACALACLMADEGFYLIEFQSAGARDTAPADRFADASGGAIDDDRGFGVVTGGTDMEGF
jgi:phage FluMu gp28-like protein